MPPRNLNPQKPRDARRTLAVLGRYLMKSAPMLAAALLLTVVSNVFQLIGPTLCGYAIDAIALESGVDFQSVFHYAALMLALYVASAAIGYAVTILILHVSQRTVRAMRADLFAKLMRLPVGYFDRNQTGDILSHISYDIDTVNTSLSNDLVQILTSLITVAGALIMMIRISPVLVLVFAVTVPVSVLFTKYMTGRVRPLYRERSRKLGELNGFVEEYVSGQKTIRAYRREDDVLGRFDRKNEDAVQSYYRSEYYASVTGPSVNFINNLSLTLISIFGALLYLAGGISLGDISSFVLYSRKFSGPINEAANILSELQSALAAAERVFSLLNEDEEPADAPGAPKLRVTDGDVALEHVDFGYDPGRPVLRDVSLRAKPGGMVAIVGPTGAGKTTLVNLLMRFYDPQSGTISIDGQAIASVQRASLREAFSMVLQDTWLFNGTVHENIAYGSPGATREQVVAAAKATHIHEMIERLPQGYDTVLTEDGVNISKGQKQLMTIARAMLRKSHLLILDEATSNVDIRTELLIQSAMRALMRGKTCFVIAHRLSTIRNADLILVVRDGQIVEQGRHDDLLARNGFYASLFRAQFE
ncbi:MAG TPA: ABC transporter ATP-binding protein [Candidatus Faecivicinus avistercoris]|nr:ABC transporter ATP-binding protein [Candidatus Faecivicinus avistercoris]